MTLAIKAERASTRPWASAGLEGRLYRLTFRLVGRNALSVAFAFAREAPEIDFALEGCFAADVDVRVCTGRTAWEALVEVEVLVLPD